MPPTNALLLRFRSPALAAGLLAAALAVASPATHAADERKPAQAPAAAGTAVPPSARLDINSASEAELAQLRGIGEARARAIVNGRPYSGRDDLVNRKIIPQGVYDEIKDQIIARQK
jgi:DNA uptake protein ComE-like DNA-binding protein